MINKDIELDNSRASKRDKTSSIKKNIHQSVCDSL
jgi:hypothetical protein